MQSKRLLWLSLISSENLQMPVVGSYPAEAVRWDLRAMHLISKSATPAEEKFRLLAC